MFGMGPARGKAAEPAKPTRAPRTPAAVALTVKLEPRLRDKFELLGGEAWLREQLEKARVPSAFSD